MIASNGTQKSTFSLTTFASWRSDWVRSSFYRWLPLELVLLDASRRLHWWWRRGEDKLCQIFELALKSEYQLSSLLQLIPLPPSHPLVHMFQIKTLSELHQPTENELALCDRLLSRELFPSSVWLMSLRACVLYHLHGLFGSFRGFSVYLTSCARIWSSWTAIREDSYHWSLPNWWYRYIFEYPVRNW